MNTKSILIDLLKQQSVTPEAKDCYKIIGKILSESGFKVKTYQHRGKSYDVSNFYARFGTKSPFFCFAGHVDVVPPNGKTWRLGKSDYDPFSAKIVKNRVYARGAADMKSGIAAFLFAIKRFIKQNPNFQNFGSIGVILTSDEEGEAIAGTDALINELSKKSKFKFDACIMAEPTSQKKVGDCLKVGRRGSLFGSLTVFGKQGHIAYPNQASNAITTIAKLISELKKINLDSQSQKLTKKLNGKDITKKLKASYQPSNLEFYQISCNNKTGNIIPGQACAEFNIRFSPKTNLKLIKKLFDNKIQAIIKKSDYQLTFDLKSEPFYGASEELIKLAKLSTRKTSKVEAKPSTLGGSSDSRFLQRCGPIIDFGLIGDSMHQVNEYVDLNDVETLSDIYLNCLNLYFLNNKKIKT